MTDLVVNPELPQIASNLLWGKNGGGALDVQINDGKSILSCNRFSALCENEKPKLESK